MSAPGVATDGVPNPGEAATSSFRYGPTALATVPNAITVARLLVTPFFLVLMVKEPVSWVTFSLGFVLAMSDLLDGWLARRWGTTRSGAFLDPLADKIFFISAMGALVVADRFWWLPVVVIAAREVWMSAYRSWLAKRGISVPATSLAKIKTNAQGLAVGFALLPLTARHLYVANTLLWVAVVLTVVTGVQYAMSGRRLARESAALAA